MITNPTEFAKYKNQDGAIRSIIVRFYDGSDYYYYSAIDMSLSDGHVYPILKTITGVSEGVDIFSKQWAASDITVTLHNVSYKKDTSGDDIRPSDEVEAFRGQSAKVYFLSGSTSSSLSDCLEVFDGLVVSAPVYDENTVQLRIIHKQSLVDQLLPYTKVGSVYSGAPVESSQNWIPIVYGEFTYDRDAFDGLGLAVAEKTDSAVLPTFVVADHVIDSFATSGREYGLFVRHDGLADPMCIPSSAPTTNVNNSGRATATTTAALLAYFLPSNIDDATYSTSIYGSPDHGGNVWDRDPTTCAEVTDSIDDGVTAVEGYALWGFADETWIHDIVVNSGLTNVASYVRYNCDEHSGVTLPTTQLQVFFGYDSGNKVATQSGTFDNTFRETSVHNIVVAEKNCPLMVGVHVKDNIAGDGTPDNAYLADVYSLQLILTFTPDAQDVAMAAVKGYEYDSWITGRSSNYSSGDCIEDPAGIVEGMLRNHGSLADADIDLTSFIAAENTSVAARINLHTNNEMTLFEAIRQITEQATFAFLFSATGRARAIPLNDSSPTTSRTIPYSHIANGKIGVSKSDWIVNSLTYSSRWQQEYERFSDRGSVTDSTSYGSFGYRRYKAEWPNIAGTSADHVAAHLVASSTGIWSNEHNVIELTTVGFTNADLEVGDWIELDDTTIDPHCKCFGVSWSGKQFLVTEVFKAFNGTRIKAIELYL